MNDGKIYWCGLGGAFPKKKMNVSGIGYFGWGVRQLVRKDERELEPIPCNAADYDLIN